jgi:hypothetical protein
MAGWMAASDKRSCPTPCAGVRSQACGSCSIVKLTRTHMDSAITLIAVLGLWWVLQVWLLPRLGVPT